MDVEKASGLVGVKCRERGRMGRSRRGPPAVFCWGRCEAFQGGGALNRPISGIDKHIPAKSSFWSIPSLHSPHQSTAISKASFCGHTEAVIYRALLTNRSASCFPTLQVWDEGSHDNNNLSSSLTDTGPPQDTCEDIEAWHYALHARGGCELPTPMAYGRTTVVQLRLCRFLGRLAAEPL